MGDGRQAHRTYRAAIVGCGGMGRNHARALTAMPEVELIGLSDIIQTSLDRAGEEAGVAPNHRFLNYEEMLDKEKPDFVVVATQAPQHAAVTLAAAARGIHVLCEKPLALDLAEADAMVDACTKVGVLLLVNHLRRVAPAPTLARDMIRSGEIGDVVAMDIHEKGGRPAGNMLMEMATHYFDAARFLLSGHRLAEGRPGDQVDWVFAHLSTGIGAAAHRATVDEIVHSQVAVPTDRDCGPVLGERGTVILGFPGEVQAVARFHNRPTADARYDGMDVIGTRGSIAIRDITLEGLYRRQGHTFAEHDPWQPVPVPGGKVPIDFSGHWSMGIWLCQEMARELIAAAEEGRDPVSSGRDGLAVLEIIMAVYESHRQGRPIPLPLPDRRHPLDVWRSGAKVPVGRPT